MELGLDMSLLWNRMTFAHSVATLGGSVISDDNVVLLFDLFGVRMTMEVGPYPIFRIGARFTIPSDEKSAFIGAASRLAASGGSVDVTVNHQAGTASFSCLGFAYGERDLSETLVEITRRIDNAASVLAGIARN